MLEGNGDGTFQTPKTFAVGRGPGPLVAGDFNGDGKLDLAIDRLRRTTSPHCKASGTGRSSTRPVRHDAPCHAPGLADVNGDGTDDVLVVDGDGRHPLSPGHSGAAGHLRAAHHHQPRLPSRDIAWVPRTAQGPLIASVDAQGRRGFAIRLAQWGLRPARSLDTGRLPVQSRRPPT